MRVFLAGATGAVGSQCLRLLKAQGHWVRALCQSERRAAGVRRIADEVMVADATHADRLTGCCRGIDAVISALGASVALSPRGRRGYLSVDLPANQNLLVESRRAAVERWIYISLHMEPAYEGTAYARAHERFVAELAQSRGTFTVVRPTGVFSAFLPFLGFARRGAIPIIGDGVAHTNPVHPADVAEFAVGSLAEAPLAIELGGPETFSRREIAELAFHVLGRKPRCIRVPPVIYAASAKLLRPLHPRLAELLEFVRLVSLHDCLAPARGTRRLEDYLRAAAV